jgi:hypothetical protein
MQAERFQDRGSIKKRNHRKDIIDRGASFSVKCNLQALEVEELASKHWSVDILKKK